MQETWKRINNWLAANFPQLQGDINSGADPEELNSLESQLLVNLPEDLKQSYLIHDGQKGYLSPMIGEWQILSIKGILKEWNLMKELFDAGKLNAESNPIGSVKSVWWNIKWIPICSNGAGDLICVDLDPAPGGEVGQIITFWHMDATREVLSNNFQSWFDKYADDLENSKYRVEDDELIYID